MLLVNKKSGKNTDTRTETNEKYSQTLIGELEMTLLLQETTNSSVLVLDKFKSETIRLFIMSIYKLHLSYT